MKIDIKNIILSTFCILFVCVCISLLLSFFQARNTENKIQQIKIGLHRSEVESLLGTGKASTTSQMCKKCPENREQLLYRGNPSLWYKHFEDYLEICYVDNVVCDFNRYGL